MPDDVPEKCHERSSCQGYREHGGKFNDQFFDVRFSPLLVNSGQRQRGRCTATDNCRGFVDERVVL